MARPAEHRPNLLKISPSVLAMACQKSSESQTMASTGGQLGSKKRRHGHISNEPPSKSRKLSEDISSTSEGRGREIDSPRPVNKHTKKERKQNRSTRIHSLRKLLSRGTLPSTITQEKERELAALIHEQDKTKTKKEDKRILERYHYVRFIERQKAEKRLKRLRKQQEAGADGQDWERRIHEMDVSRNYAIYAPLDQKYISIFASQVNKENGGGDEQEEMDDNPDDSAVPAKPPMWYIVEAAMRRGESELKALRDGKSITATSTRRDDNQDTGVVPPKNTREAKSRKTQKKSAKTDSHEQMHDHEATQQSEDSEEDDSMSDGGFFDR